MRKYLIILLTLISVWVMGQAGSTGATTSGPWKRTGSYVYYNGGNVGIGTATPAYKFQINGTGAYNDANAARFDIFNATYGTTWFTHISNSGEWQLANGVTTKILIAPTSNGAFSFYHGSGKVTFSGTGQVGVGTDATEAKFHVKGDVNGSVGAIVHNPNAGTAAFSAFTIGNSPAAAPWDGLYFEHYGTGFTTAGLRKASMSCIMSGDGATNGLMIGTGANADLIFFTNTRAGGADMTLKNTGELELTRFTRQVLKDTTGVGSTANVGIWIYHSAAAHFYGLVAGTPPTWKQLDN